MNPEVSPLATLIFVRFVSEHSYIDDIGDDEAECRLVHFTLTTMLEFWLNYPIGQLTSFLLPLYPHQALSYT